MFWLICFSRERCVCSHDWTHEGWQNFATLHFWRSLSSLLWRCFVPYLSFLSGWLRPNCSSSPGGSQNLGITADFLRMLAPLLSVKIVLSCFLFTSYWQVFNYVSGLECWSYEGWSKSAFMATIWTPFLTLLRRVFCVFTCLSGLVFGSNLVYYIAAFVKFLTHPIAFRDMQPWPG